jgi:glycosyltransferase involved in cell wall biosynthesis
MRIALLSYRGNPYCGGQGVYVYYLSRELTRLGHQVVVLAGPPYPRVPEGVPLVRVPSLDLYAGDGLSPRCLRRARGMVDFLEYAMAVSGLYPEPLTFSLRVVRLLQRWPVDVVHDNQSLGFGLLRLKARGLTVVATIHHPIHIDRAFALAAARSRWERWGVGNWYWFLWMQGIVARRLPLLITVSQRACADVVRYMGVDARKLRVVANGVDAQAFRPLPGVERHPRRLILVNSADMPIKGLQHFYEAMARVAAQRPVEVVVVGEKRPGHLAYLTRYRLDGRVRFLGRLETEDLVREYSKAALAICPSLYEGFGLPAAEAMACGVPVVAFAAGALPEVVGDDGEAGCLVPCYDAEAMARAIVELLDDPERRARMGEAGRQRVLRLFSWERAARETVRVYEEALALRRGPSPCSP